MALADYYGRGALAAAQVLEGFDEARFRTRLEEFPIGVAFDAESLTPEGETLLDLLVRLLARLYPHLTLRGPSRHVRALAELATSVNPAIEIGGECRVGVSLGRVKDPFETTFYAGASRWDALLSTTRPQPIGDSENPFGAGAAACLAAGNVFRRVFFTDWHASVDPSVRFSTLHLDRVDRATRGPGGRWQLDDEAVIVGVGAVGNAAAWALARAPLLGAIHLVDPEAIELGNLQRYVLTRRSDEAKAKVELAASVPTRGLSMIPHHLTLAQFLSRHGYAWDYFLLALDTARDRRSAQAALPRWIANAWTQPGDLGVSVHPRFGFAGACVACLYLPDGRVPNEDELVSQTLNVPQLQMDIRTLLYNGAPLQRDFLEVVAGAVNRPIDALLPFEGRSIRDLYVEGFCGGAVIPLGEAGRPPQELHVPLAHQSALAGVLLAAALVRSALGADPPITSATRLNMLQGVGSDLTQPVQPRRDGRCLCDDRVFCDRYLAKYP
jgi:Prokaryotic E2 family C/ThiF family